MTDDSFEGKCVSAMKEFFGSDRRRIDPALRVLEYARKIHAFEVMRNFSFHLRTDSNLKTPDMTPGLTS